jgi:hypothetical protein
MGSAAASKAGHCADDQCEQQSEQEHLGDKDAKAAEQQDQKKDYQQHCDHLVPPYWSPFSASHSDCLANAEAVFIT